ncbi:hypothetical protein ACVIQY_005151 [Bradyrhizobium sp. USDA 3051]|jgi:hypothetical protein
MRAGIRLVLLLSQTTTTFAACGDRGGPGYRGPSGRCVGWADIGRTCGIPPSTRCTAESVATGFSDAADHEQKAWDAGKRLDKRQVGRIERFK